MKENKNQETIITSNDNLLVIASAGCGKSFCIRKKTERLTATINPKDILVISFTNETVNDLKSKLHPDIQIKTFHKLAMMVLENDDSYKLCASDYLEYTIDEYFNNLISKKDKKKLLKYFFNLSYKKLLNNQNFLDYKKTIATFIKLMKCNNYDIEFLKEKFLIEKEKFLFSIIMKIYFIYENDKKSQNLIDLDDLIINASIQAKNNFYNFKYIFVDEFQDTSQIRFELIFNIYKNSKSKINFFGDDFQSIYAFSGCNLNIMLDIKKHIPDIITLHLDKNFRSDNHLITSANNFVLKNPKQLRKKISSDTFVENSINFIKYKNFNTSFNKLYNKLYKENTDIMILGRYKKDFEYLNVDAKKITIHESKGLEADYVIIVNNKDTLFGFPSNIKNHNLLDHFENSDSFLYSEERRLFYVAVTRARKKVFLMYPKDSPSPFVKEFKKIVKSTSV